MVKKITPCANCPWRKDAPRQHWHPDHFKSVATTCRDDGMALMGCHKSKKDKLVPCVGSIISIGFQSIGLRLAVLSGRVNLDDYTADGIELFETYEEMLEANNVPVPPRNTFLERLDGSRYVPETRPSDRSHPTVRKRRRG